MTSRCGVAAGLPVLVLLMFAGTRLARAQNVVAGDALGVTTPPVKVSLDEVTVLIHSVADYKGVGNGYDPRRVAAKLDAHAAEFVAGFPYMPFHNTLGISGYETYFDHPDHLFYALSIALPYLTPRTGLAVRGLLSSRLTTHPPYTVEGFDRSLGRPREAYDVPPELRAAGRGQASSAFGVYAFWAYTYYASDTVAANAHWVAVRARLQPLLNAPYVFNIQKQDYSHDEAQQLNGDLAGLIAGARLAHTNGDTTTEQQAVARVRELLELRINLERVNPRILETTSSTTKHLHSVKLARFCDLVPEAGEAVRRLTDGTGAAHLQAFREARNGWYLAFGERMVGGENYINPPHLSHALFNGATYVERLSPDQLTGFVDVPWCKGDFYFMEKCAGALWASGDRKWTTLP